MPHSLSSPFEIAGRHIGPTAPPLVIAEIGINHEGSLTKALRMVDDAAAAGCECVKFQCHVIEDEMIPNDVIPGNATESIWDIMARCRLTDDEDRQLKAYVESKGMLYLSTPFSRAAADRLELFALPAGARLLSLRLIFANIGAVNTTLGVVSGEFGTTDNARTVGTELFSAQTMANAEVNVPLAACLALGRDQTRHRGIGMRPASDIAAGGTKTVTVVATYQF